MVVDDERELADLVAFYLQNEGFEVAVFYSGGPALEYACTQRLDMAYWT